MTNFLTDPAIIALHEDLFETQVQLQTRLLDFIEEVDEFLVLDEAWGEFNHYEDKEMDSQDPEPILHFFPWALFYWRREIPQSALDAAQEEAFEDGMVLTEPQKQGADGELPETLDDETIEQVLSEELEDDEAASDLNDEGDNDEHGNDEDEGSYVTLPSIATMFMNSVDGADGDDSAAVQQVLNDKERGFILAAAQSAYSFFRVTAVGPGAFVTLEDLIVPAQMAVYAPSVVDMLEEDDVIYAQVVEFEEARILCGVAPSVLPPVVLESVQEASERIQTLIPEMADDWRYEIEFELRSLFLQMVASLQGPLDDNQAPNIIH